MKYEELLNRADTEGLLVKEKPLRANKGRIKGHRVAIKSDMVTTEKACVLAEELGHYYTSTGDILDQDSVSNRKQEHQARMWAYEYMAGIYRIADALRHGCRTRYETAEYLDVTEEFLEELISAYADKYGDRWLSAGNCKIRFRPLDFFIGL